VAHHAVVSNYPGNWMDDVVRQTVKEHLIWKDKRHVVDVWTGAVDEVGDDGVSVLEHFCGSSDVDVDEARSILRKWVSSRN
jgi:hypothetical protein